MTASTINFSDSVPAAGSGKINAKWQNDGGTPTVNISAELPDPTVEVVTFSGTAGTLAHTPTKILGGYRNGIRMQSSDNTRADYFSVSTATVTLATAAGGSDVFIFVYYY